VRPAGRTELRFATAARAEQRIRSVERALRKLAA
jgi:hypothetical protein